MGQFEAFIIGLVQGLTEFLPVSSSGHIALFQHWFGITEGNLSLTIVAHLGTLLAILFYYRIEFNSIFKNLFRSRTSLLVNPTIRLVLLVVVASIPAAIVGIFLKEYIDTVFQSSRWLGVFFLFTAFILFLSRLRSTDYESMKTNTEYISHQITFSQAFLIGLAQAVAIFPGVSRSGMTITAALFLGLKKQNAAFFSFLISVPAILGACFLDFKNISAIENVPSLLTLFTSSLVFGFIGLWGVIHILHRGKLHYFTIYLLPLGLYVLFKY
jgi:undecaprenyl-diphosphatase